MKNNCSKPAPVLSLTLAITGLILVLWPTSGQCQRSSQPENSSVAATDPNAPAPPRNSWASFDIILKRNIFSRQRHAALPAREREERAAPPAPNPEAYYILRGVVQENDNFIAFIEDTQTGTVLKLGRGDPVARGTIKTLTLDGLEYQMEDKTTVVRLGLDLEGGYGAVTSRQTMDMDLAALPAPSTTGQPAQTPATAPSGDEADILKRMMEQRRQQLGQ